MGQQIINDLRDVITAGNYTGGNITHNNYYDHQIEKDMRQGNK